MKIYATAAKAVISGANALGFSENEKTIDSKTAYFHGYNFGDRLLEGVFFKAEILDNGDMEITVAPKCKSYFESLNTKKWLRAAADYALSEDVFEEGCDTGRQYILLQRKWERVSAAVAIKMTGFGDLLKELDKSPAAKKIPKIFRK